MDSCVVLDSAESIDKQTIEKRKRQQQSKSSQVSKNSIYFTLICLLLTIVAVDANPSPSQSSKSNQFHDSGLITSSNSNSDNNNNNNQQQNQQDQQSKAALEAELNSIVQQHDAYEGNNKLLAEAIISRLMVDNLTGSNLLQNSGDLDGSEFDDGSSQAAIQEANQAALIEQPQTSGQQQQQQQQQQQYVGPTGPEAMRLKKLLSFLQNYENNMAGSGGTSYATASMFNPFPLLPSGQATTMKRAAMKMGAYLQPQRHLSTANSYPRNQFDFGLGKRPDSSISSNILRLGDSMSSAGGPIQPLNSFGKRPSAHRFDFGLGKRVASPAYPRYDFGLGKRAPNRIRYDFGLGKK